MSCFVTYGIEGDNLDPVAYASYILTSTDDVPDTDANVHNLSMLIEADIMELPAGGMYFIPKKYCLDLDIVDPKSNEDKWGMSAPGNVMFKDTVPNILGTKEHERTISLGVKEGTLRSYFNRLARITSWAHKRHNYTTEKSDEWSLDLIRSAYNTPKAELLGILGWLLRNPCKELNVTFDEGGIYECACLENKKILNDFPGLETRFDATIDSLVNFFNMQDYLENWKFYLDQKHNGTEYTDEELNQNVVDGFITEDHADIFRSTRRSRMLPVPYIFDRDIALWKKNSMYPALKVNPYHSSESFQEEGKDTFDACFDEYSTKNVLNIAYFFQGAIKRRIFEHRGLPSAQVAQWTIPADPFNIAEQNSHYLKQNVSWDNSSSILQGNLTEKVLGRTAKWLMVTPWEDTTNLQNLVGRVQDTATYYSTAASSAYDPGNPCSEAVTDEEIFLFVLSIALAGFGGVHALLETTHRAIHWWITACCGLPTQNTPTRRLRCSAKFFPTYEAMMVLFGIACFAALYIPLIFQIEKEYEVANFQTEEVSFDVNYAPQDPEQLMVHSMNQAALVSMVHAETSCENARPELLVGLLVGGVTLSVLANAPYIMRALGAFYRCCCCSTRPATGEHGYTPSSKDLMVLTPATSEDFRSDVSARHLWSSCAKRSARNSSLPESALEE